VIPLASLTARATAYALKNRLTGQTSTQFHVRTAEQYADLLGQSKGALMKVGQMLSFAAVRTTLPPELQAIYQTAFERLRDEAPPMAPALARMTLERELGHKAEAVFSEFDWQPFAAASIGQVHAARLREDGRAVAVKIQYPQAAETIRADLQNVELLATFLSLTVGGLFPRGLRLNFRGAAREIGTHLEEELDYRHEAHNQSEFAQHYRGHPFIHVPELVDELCTHHVLTQELVPGRSFSEALAADQNTRDRWAEAIHRYFYGSHARLHLFNADPHPGNYLFHDDGSVTFLDYGSVKRMQPDQVAMITAIYRECLRGDVLATWRASVEAGVWRSTDPVTAEEAFAYWREDNALFWSPERFVASPDYVAKGLGRRFSPTGPSGNALRYCNLPSEYTLLARVEIGLMSVIARLRAGNDWGSFAAEYCEGAPPRTAMGRREQAFFERRRVARSV
jgi:predicted unusual protein kinase regulating ubiquinone biosynthesis (AarF/ABC1/UbiB family)